MEAPVVLCDEFIYSNVAKNLAEHGRYLFRGVPSHSSYLYPLLIAPAWLFDSMATTYALAKSIGAASMTLVAIPTYLWARRLVGPWHSLLAAALTLLLPAFFYAGLLMTEAAFLPAFVLVGFAIAAMLERPTLVNQLGALAALVLAISIRVQGIVLVAVIPTAVLLKVVLDWRAGVTRDRVLTDLRRLWPTAVVLVGGAVLYVVYKEARGEGLATGLGPYQTLAQLHYPLEPSARWSVRHLAELVLALGYVPVAALIVLLWLGFVSASVSNAERCFLAVVSATGNLATRGDRRILCDGGSVHFRAVHVLPRTTAPDRVRRVARPRAASTGDRNGGSGCRACCAASRAESRSIRWPRCGQRRDLGVVVSLLDPSAGRDRRASLVHRVRGRIRRVLVRALFQDGCPHCAPCPARCVPDSRVIHGAGQCSSGFASSALCRRRRCELGQTGSRPR